MMANKNSFLSLGSNLGNRSDNLISAILKLSEHPKIQILCQSDIYQTEPMAMSKNVPWFLNQCIQIATNLSAHELLAVCERIESVLGRKNKSEGVSRIIDIDILTYSSERIDEERLSIPHPRMLERNFVLVPLVEIASKYKKDLENCSDKHKVTPYESRAA